MRIPFEIPNANETDEVAGFLYLENEFLVFDFHILKWGITKGESSTVKAERGVIDDIRVEQGWYKDRLLVATHNLNLLKEIPGPHLTEVELRTKKKHRREVDAFVKRVLAWKAEEAA